MAEQSTQIGIMGQEPSSALGTGRPDFSPQERTVRRRVIVAACLVLLVATLSAAQTMVPATNPEIGGQQNRGNRGTAYRLCMKSGDMKSGDKSGDSI